MNLRGASLEDLTEFRVDFEGENAAWAARRVDGHDVAALEALVEEARRAALEAVAELDVRWHETLARETKNRLRIGIALGIHEAVLRRHRATIPAHERSRSIQDEIDAIARAVAAGDPDGARQLMRAHIQGWMGR